MELRMFDDLEHLSRAAAEVVVREAGRAVEARGRFLLVLSGGGTPARLYGILGESPLREAVPWDRVHVFWGDERCVPADHPDSNYALAQKTLLDRVPCPEAHVHRMAGELGARAAADRYEMELRDFFAPGGPEFDLVLLGMGPDGHTASLFPGQEVLDEKVRLTAPVQPPPSIRPAVPRLTLTPVAINAGRTALFLIAGPDKRDALGRIHDGRAPELPAARVRPRDTLLFYVDRAAAG